MASAQSDELGAADAQASGEPVVNVQIVSPSVGVNRPLLFPGTPASTTIKQLKEKIREALPLRPADEHQRLIHRGRALMRDSDSLLDVLGAESGLLGQPPVIDTRGYTDRTIKRATQRPPKAATSAQLVCIA
ncbi:hypothetical protein K4F52_009997 [Lecanicillium sp. MT-2017a]|nr:hypothetical protein K4F52_009997 [Lecanicillium sp. MT-2017a]